MIFQSLKNKLILIITFLLISNFASAEIVKKIVIEGNDRVNSETIKVFGGISINDDLNADDLNTILKKLYDTDFFETIELSLNNKH